MPLIRYPVVGPRPLRGPFSFQAGYKTKSPGRRCRESAASSGWEVKGSRASFGAAFSFSLLSPLTSALVWHEKHECEKTSEFPF